MMETQQGSKHPEAMSDRRSKGNIHDMGKWNAYQKELQAAEDEPKEDEPKADPDDTVMQMNGPRVNKELDRMETVREQAFAASDAGKTSSTMSRQPRRQQSKPPKKPGFFAKLFGGFFRNKS